MSEDELNRLRAEFNELAELAGSLAHEIKNPLSVIRMNMDLLAEDLAEPSTDAERRALKKTVTVREQCERLEHLLNDFLRFARLRDLTLSPGNINDQLSRVLDLFEVQAKESGVRGKAVPGSKPPQHPHESGNDARGIVESGEECLGGDAGRRPIRGHHTGLARSSAARADRHRGGHGQQYGAAHV